MLSPKFWSQVSKGNGCWEWLGTKTEKGYGIFHGSKCKIHRAHRLMYESEIGLIPKGFLVLHKCDNPSCVNPLHLFLGTAKDNYNDMVQKGRQVRACGEKAHSSKLNLSEVIEIRRDYWLGKKTIHELGVEHSISDNSCRMVVKRLSWGHIPKIAEEINPLSPKRVGRARGLKRKTRAEKMTDEERFWSKVDKSDSGGCWIYRSSSKYIPVIIIDKRSITVSRYAYLLSHGYLPQKFILHICNNPLCVNPLHLKEGLSY